MDEKDRQALAALMEHAPPPGEHPVDEDRRAAIESMEQQARAMRADRAVLAADTDWVDG